MNHGTGVMVPPNQHKQYAHFVRRARPDECPLVAESRHSVSNCLILAEPQLWVKSGRSQWSDSGCLPVY
jgi:hypothetical protein